MKLKCTLATLALLISGWPSIAFSGNSTNRTLTGQEYVRNGTFDAGNAGWAVSPTWSYVDPTGGLHGGPALRLNHLSSDGPALGIQRLHLPTTISKATLNYVVRIEPGQQPVGATALFGVQVMDDAEALFEDAAGINTAVDWTPISVELPSEAISAIQRSFNAGKQIYLSFVLLNSPGAFYTAFVDNVSLLVDGEMAYPGNAGTIGFISQHGQHATVASIQPDGSGRHTLWTHPSAIVASIYDVAWHPNGREIAFVSNHESAYSPFHSDIYAMAPDGNGLRRISNAPMQAGWPQGRRTGAVTGRIYNAHNSFGYTFLIYVEGAREIVSVNLPEFGQQVDFTIPDVADNGDGVLQTIVFNWSRSNCANGKEFSVPINVIPGQTVDVGTINFNGYCNQYNISDISWKADGSSIGGVMINGSRRFDSRGESIGRELFISQDRFSKNLSWSPVDDQVLSTQQTQAVNDGIFLGTAGGNPGSQIAIDNQTIQQNPAWLPGGDGFVFTYNSNIIGRYDFASRQGVPLVNFFNEIVATLTVSPDGNYVAFERSNAQGAVDIWVMSLRRTNLMWPLTQDGVSSNPDWSRVDPRVEPLPTSTTLDNAAALPEQLVLHPNFPNPFNAETAISFELPAAALVQLQVYNITGQWVTTLTDQPYPAGRHQVIWKTAEGLANGLYFCRLQAGSFRATGRMLLLK